MAISPGHNSAIGRENDFSGKASDWECRVFLNANAYVVIVFKGTDMGSRFGSARLRREFKDYISALAFASRHRRSLIYATTASGRADCLAKSRWQDYRLLWPHALLAGGSGLVPETMKRNRNVRRF